MALRLSEEFDDDGLDLLSSSKDKGIRRRSSKGGLLALVNTGRFYCVFSLTPFVSIIQLAITAERPSANVSPARIQVNPAAIVTSWVLVRNFHPFGSVALFHHLFSRLYFLRFVVQQYVLYASS
jgi:hypothetical protein